MIPILVLARITSSLQAFLNPQSSVRQVTINHIVSLKIRTDRLSDFCRFLFSAYSHLLRYRGGFDPGLENCIDSVRAGQRPRRLSEQTLPVQSKHDHDDALVCKPTLTSLIDGRIPGVGVIHF